MRKIHFSLSILLIGGCISAPGVEPIPQSVYGEPNLLNESIGQKTTSHWWLSLQDEKLNELIELGLRGSPTGQIALARFAQAQMGLKIKGANRWPSFLGSSSREVQNVSGSSASARSNFGSLGLSWDANLWGKRSLQIERVRQFKNQRWYEYQLV